MSRKTPEDPFEEQPGEPSIDGTGVAQDAAAFWRHFYEIYEDLPRQGPGARESTERALAALPPLTPRHRILDVGCGTGAQSLDLARASGARIVAIDNHPPFVARLAECAFEAGLGERVRTEVGDMTDLRFPDGSFDVLWCEGAIFIIGFAKGLAEWRRLLTPGGHLVVSEFCWLTDDPPAEMAAMLAEEGADIGDVASRRASIRSAGYRTVDEFTLPPFGWWENYYVPLAARLERFREEHADNADALAVAERSEREIDLYRRFGGSFGYVFFVMQRDESVVVSAS